MNWRKLIAVKSGTQARVELFPKKARLFMVLGWNCRP